jgi:hypothetical protein
MNRVSQARKYWYAVTLTHAHFKVIKDGCLDLLVYGV